MHSRLSYAAPAPLQDIACEDVAPFPLPVSLTSISALNTLHSVMDRFLRHFDNYHSRSNPECDDKEHSQHTEQIAVDYPSGLIRFRPEPDARSVALVPYEFDAGGLQGFANEA